MRAPTLLALMPLALALAAAAPPPKPPPAPEAEAPQPVAVAIPPGPVKDTVRKVLLLAYAKATGTDLGDPPWDGSLAGLHGPAAANGVDLALADGPMLAAGCSAQLFDKINWNAAGDRGRYWPGATSDCGVGAYVSATVMAWDRDKLPGTPSWGDFWDVAKYPGRRGLHRGARGNLEIALLADGVSPGDIYRTLRSPEGVDRAFRKLDQLKPYIEWWNQISQPIQLLASAKVLLTSAPAASLQAGPKLHVGMQWTGSLTEVASWARLAGAQHSTGASAAIQVASDAARQAEFARATGLGPATRAGFALLPASLRAQSASLPANAQAGLAMDEGFWLDNAGKLEARFAAWVGK